MAERWGAVATAASILPGSTRLVWFPRIDTEVHRHENLPIRIEHRRLCATRPGQRCGVIQSGLQRRKILLLDTPMADPDSEILRRSFNALVLWLRR